MKKAAIPVAENERLEALRRLRVLDTLADPVLDAITATAAQVCETPVALISFVDEHRLWVKSAVGTSVTETPRDGSFCSDAILATGNIYEIEDSGNNPNFKKSPFSTSNQAIVFYAAVPLVTSDGYAVGTLSVMDSAPRKLTAHQKKTFQHLSNAIVPLLEERRQSSLAYSEMTTEQTAASGVFILDPESEGCPVTYCNLNYERLAGLSHNEIIGRSFASLNSDIESISAEELLEALLATHETLLVHTSQRKGADSCRATLTLSPLFNAAGSLNQIVGIQNIVSDEFTSQRELKKAQLFLEAAPDATVILDDSGNLVLANREAEYLFGYSNKELLSMPIEALMPARYRHQHLNHRKTYASNPIVREMGQDLNITALTKSGAEVPVDIRLSPINSDGQQFYSASIRDITTHVDIQQVLHDAKSTAERATEQKSRFLAAAGHDLRQPLQAISLYLSVLGRTQDETKRGEISRKIQLSLDNINGMLGALLDVSKLESGAIKPEKSKVKLQTIFDKIMATNLQQATEKGLEFTCNGTEALVYTDPVLLERVIENFVTNAIRYTATGGITLFAKTTDQNLLIGVKDTGLGIDHAQLDQVFEEYYQLDNPMRDRTKGLGLGLSIVKHISTLLGHTIDIQSEVGSGSTFSITVPLAMPDESDTHTSNTGTERKSVSEKKPQILLVEDDTDVMDSTAMFLESAGMDVLTAYDSDQGLAHINNGKLPDLIISDYRLPGMNGCEMLEKIRQKTRSEIPAIIITGDTAPNELTENHMTNCELLYKPVVTERLLELIWEAL